MTQLSSKKHFGSMPGIENSITIYRLIGSNQDQQVGFVSESKNFYLDTNGEQVNISDEEINDLAGFIKSLK